MSLEYLELLEERARRRSEQKLFYEYFPDDHPYSIEHYPKQFEFFANGLTASKRLIIAGNRVGKTEAACFETTCHAIGWYPSWWPGFKFKEGMDLLIWVAGDTNKTIRDILQVKLLGSSQLSKAGCGIIPRKYIQENGITKTSGVADLCDSVFINRIGGGTTQIQFKSYLGGRDTFQGTEPNYIHLDEEPPLDIYLECLMRTLTNNGKVVMTFTPLMGITQLIQEFMKSAEDSPDDIKITNIEWDDVPHLDEEAKRKMMLAIPEWMRDARMKGTPMIGSGAIYRVHLDDILVEDRKIEDHWKRCYALDVGWRTTAVLFGATDPNTGITYIYDEIYVNEKLPRDYADMIKLRGEWIPGVVDSASNNASQHDGQKIFDMLKEQKLDLTFPDKSVQAGLTKTWQWLSGGQLKVFKSCKNFQDEYRLYRRDEKGKIVKQKDHLMDCMRYLVMSGVDRAKSKQDLVKKTVKHRDFTSGSNGWMS